MTSLKYAIQKYDMLIILGFNAKTGKENHTAQIAGNYTIHKETSVYGNLLAQIAQTNTP